MPRFLASVDMRDRYSLVEWGQLLAAVVHNTADCVCRCVCVHCQGCYEVLTCECERCTCGCVCGSVRTRRDMVKDQRFIAYLIAWRHNPTWYADDAIGEPIVPWIPEPPPTAQPATASATYVYGASSDDHEGYPVG
jgi:hypothetical protein